MSSGSIETAMPTNCEGREVFYSGPRSSYLVRNMLGHKDSFGCTTRDSSIEKGQITGLEMPFKGEPEQTHHA